MYSNYRVRPGLRQTAVRSTTDYSSKFGINVAKLFKRISDAVDLEPHSLPRTRTTSETQFRMQIPEALKAWASQLWEQIRDEIQDGNNTITQGEKSHSGSSQGLNFVTRTRALWGNMH